MSLTEFRRKKMNRQPLIKYLLPIFTALCATALVFTGCADSAESSSKTSAEKISVTVKTEADVSSDRSILPSLCGTFRLYFKEKGASDSDYTLADGEYPDYQMIIIPGEYTFRLESVISEDNSTVILTGETDFTVESGMENVTICFMLSSPEGATGDGSVSLFLSADTDTNIETFSVSAVGTEGESSFSWLKDEEETSYLKGTLSCTSLKPGTYTLVITGFNSLNEPVYVRHEVLTLWSNVVSGRWLFADGTETDELTITTSDLYSTFYVKGEEGPYNFYKEGVFGDANASDDNSGSIDCPLSTVSAAVNKCVVSNKPYTIYVDGTVKEAIDSTSTDPSAIEIYKKIITIKSIKPEVGKAVIQADGNGRIMYAGGTVVLEDLELKGGGNTNLGGGIFVGHASVLTMKNCTITECNATHQGGGLYIYSQCSANLSGCTISGNEATDENSGIGGGIMAYGTLIADGTSISNNNSGNGGGGIYIESDVTATITDCTISENIANGSGGGLKICSPAKLTNCTIKKNTANNISDGGGLQCIRRDTTQINVEFKNCKIFNNTSGNSGGGVSIDSNVNATFTSCNIEGNTTTWNGGGLLLWHKNDYPDPNVTLTDCTISGNTAGGSGGAIHTDGGGLTLTLTGTSSGGGTKISGNTSSTNDPGKSIYLKSGYMNISGYIQITSDNPARLRTGRTTITGTLTGTTPVITVTPESYTEGTQIVSAGDGVTLADEAGKFKISNTDYIISKEGKLCYLGTTSTTASDNIAVFTNIPAGCEATVNLDNLSQTSWSGSSPASISGNVTLTASTSTTISSGSDSIFTVKNGGTLTLNENVTLETSSQGTSCINVEEGGTLILNGATIQATSGFNVSGITITHGTLTINTGNITNFTGSPIVATNSIITITGGTISSNFSNVKLTDCTANIKNLIVTGNTTSGNGGGDKYLWWRNIYV